MTEAEVAYMKPFKTGKLAAEVGTTPLSKSSSSPHLFTVLLRTIPGVGAVTASAIIASIGDGHQFSNGREFAAWLGLTPANKSSGGKEKLGRITKMGDQYLRSLLVVGMTSLVRQTKSHPERASKWLTSLLERKPARVATVAMANKTARIVWAVLTRNEPYTPHTT